ncbi:transmembrane protein, putative [Medicago truncatula]|uniref:Transmembrane protein, putative n=1 Tax=Medicago truncatula TaxID=3880 RepID=G7INE4_MEDTR|nr:transmembrane protein, putative [Medicago truncatula]
MRVIISKQIIRVSFRKSLHIFGDCPCASNIWRWLVGAFVCSKVDGRRLNCEQDGEFCLIVGYVIILIELNLCSFGTLHSNRLIPCSFDFVLKVNICDGRCSERKQQITMGHKMKL